MESQLCDKIHSNVNFIGIIEKFRQPPIQTRMIIMICLS